MKLIGDFSYNHMCTVLVCSCDEYEDMIGPFSVLWAKFWPDCPFETVLVTETKPEKTEDLVFDKVIYTGEKVSWSERVFAALQRIESPYVILFCNDYFLRSHIDTALVLARLAQIVRYNASNLRLMPLPRAKLDFVTSPDEPPLREYEKGTPYCIAAQVGIWEKGYLKQLTGKTKSAWEFERKGSFLALGDERPLLCVPTKEFPYLDVIHKGRWTEDGAKLCMDNEIDMDFSKRGFVPLAIKVKEGIRATMLKILPRTFLLRIRNHLQRS